MQVNGEQVTLETPVSVADYLEAHGFRAERVAIELNGEIIPRDKRARRHARRPVRHGNCAVCTGWMKGKAMSNINPVTEASVEATPLPPQPAVTNPGRHRRADSSRGGRQAAEPGRSRVSSRDSFWAPAATT